VRPHAKGVKLICAGSSDEGLAFTAKYADYAFALGKGTNTPTAFAPVNKRLEAAAAKTGRRVGSYLLMMIIADETDEKAMAKWQLYREGEDRDATKWLANQAAPNVQGGAQTNTTQLADPTSAVNLNMGTRVGSYETVAKMLDEVAAVPGTSGVLLTFDEFVSGVENFGKRIQPLMKCRSHVKVM
jgi:pyrimidine oxygenase